MRTILTLIATSTLIACGPGETEEADPCEESGNICTWMGVPQTAMLAAEGVHRSETFLYLPQSITFADDGSVFFPDFNNHRVRQVDPDGMVTTVSGTGFLGDGPEGTSLTYAWNHPTGIAIDPTNPDILHVAGWHNSRIVQIDLAAGLTTFECGTGGRDYAGDGGDALMAVLDLPSSIGFDADGNMYISDQANQAIRMVDPSGVITTIAGQPGEENAFVTNNVNGCAEDESVCVADADVGYAGDGGMAIDAVLHGQVGQAADPSSKMKVHDGMLYLTDTGNNIVRVIDLQTGTIDRVAGVPWHRHTTEVLGAVDPEDLLPEATDPAAGDGGDALDAYLNQPRDVAVGVDGELYIADTDNNCIRVVQPNGVIETFAGTCGAVVQPGDAFVGEGEPAADALLFKPYAITVGPDGDVYISDTFNHVIRRVKH